LHTADVHLGARHADMGDAAVLQRERQFDAFRATVDLALAERVDLVLVAGDLFDSNVQPRRSVDRVAAELARLVEARIRAVLIPGTHDIYDRASVYRAYDLPAMSGSGGPAGLITLLAPERPWVHIAALDAVIHSAVFTTKRAPYSPLRDLPAAIAASPSATWRLGLLHASVAIPGKVEQDEVVITTGEIAASGLDYLALGHWHSAQNAKAGSVTYAYSGAPEPVAVDQDRAGSVLLVTLDERDGRRSVAVEERTVGRTHFAKVDLDAGTIATQPELISRLRAKSDPDLVLDVRLTGVRSDDLDLEFSEIEAALRGSFLRLRLRDASVAAPLEGAPPPPATVAGAFLRDIGGQVAALEAAGQGETAAAAELKDALRLGRLLLSGHEVTL
jgi:DNA repair exonuclease SbcCD nuclease subunit